MGKAKRKLMKGQPIGSRSASGRKRDRAPARVDPCLGIIRRKEELGVATNDTNTTEAFGRAYVSGLFGNGDRARDMLTAAERIHVQYWRVYLPMGYLADSLARFFPQDAKGSPLSPEQRVERERIMEDSLNDALALVRARGRDVAKAFEQLIIDPNPDQGPAWLDSIIWAHRHKKQASERDYAMLALAKEGLEALI